MNPVPVHPFELPVPRPGEHLIHDLIAQALA
ncbi:hypothetical protein BJ998_000976 [Kutzneria kofuensis]|uniref:Uncharacterized protein n=1 Tax=Kutzneria kofuensis TaxID=103725 RepID=A0A7W9KC83_9PSEU|nr:hypothetical protein [Kutzneria kofuensis]